MASIADVQALIDDFIDNYGVKAFHNMNLHRILSLMLQILGSGGGSTSPPNGYFPTLTITQADFTTATDCPIPALDGYNIEVFYNDVSRYLDIGTDWQVFVGGGFTILIPGFDATASGFKCKFKLTPAAA